MVKSQDLVHAMPAPCLNGRKDTKPADFPYFTLIYQKMIHIANYENFSDIDLLNIIIIIFLCTGTKLFQ